MKVKNLAVSFCIAILIMFIGCGNGEKDGIPSKTKDTTAKDEQAESLSMEQAEQGLDEILNYNLVEIKGNTYDLAEDFEKIVGNLVQDGMLVLDPASIDSAVYEANGQRGEGLWVKDGSDASRHINEKYLALEKNFNDRIFLVAYKEHRQNTYRKYYMEINSNMMVSFNTADNINEYFMGEIVDYPQYLYIGRNGWEPCSSASDIYAGVIADGELLDLKGYEDKMQEAFRTIWPWPSKVYSPAAFHKDSDEFDGKLVCAYGSAADADAPTLGFETSQEYADGDEEFRNYALLVTALADCSERMNNGELDTVIVVTYAWAEDEEEPRAGIRWDVYRKD